MTELESKKNLSTDTGSRSLWLIERRVKVPSMVPHREDWLMHML